MIENDWLEDEEQEEDERLMRIIRRWRELLLANVELVIDRAIEEYPHWKGNDD